MHQVQECDINNPLAHFVAFEDIGSSANVKKLLAKSGLKISLELFVSLMNLCDDVNDLKIIKNMKQYSKADAKDVVRYVIDNCKNKDVNFILNLMHVLKMSEDDNTVILEELYNNKKINKLTLLSELKTFASNNSGFKYNTIKFDEYSAHWNKVKNKQTSMNQQAMEKYNAELEQEKNSKKSKASKKGKLVPILVTAFCVVMAAIAVVCFVI